ncbi:MAG: hypothetical protein WA323_06820 [Candidatus Nitrosopolaris sp.]|jgi:hypothetical protein
MEHTRPSLAFRIESIRKSFLDAKDRDVKLRYITEITTENIPYCKELMKIAVGGFDTWMESRVILW